MPNLSFAAPPFVPQTEVAIFKLLREVLKTLRIQGVEQASEQHSVVYDPSSNGATENACKQVGGNVRTLKSDLEARWDR